MAFCSSLFSCFILSTSAALSSWLFKVCCKETIDQDNKLRQSLSLILLLPAGFSKESDVNLMLTFGLSQFPQCKMTARSISVFSLCTIMVSQWDVNLSMAGGLVPQICHAMLHVCFDCEMTPWTHRERHYESCVLPRNRIHWPQPGCSHLPQQPSSHCNYHKCFQVIVKHYLPEAWHFLA